MTPTWYDLLGVDPDADTAEIRAAWREAVADLDPTDRRFGVLNRAAKVLLDPASRAAYDAELAAAEEETDPQDDDPLDEVDVAEPAPGTAVAPVPAVEEETAPDAEPDEEPDDEPGTAEAAPATERRGSLLVTLLAAVLAVAFVVVGVVAWATSDSEAGLEAEVVDARSAAEEAVGPVLSYDATDLEAGRSAATSYLTDDFAEEYEELFDGLIEANAADLGARVESSFLASGVVRSAPGEGRVQVLVFFDQTVTNDASATPRTNSNQATLTMQLVGDRWLVDDIATGAAG